MDRKVVVAVAVIAVLGLAVFFRYETVPAGNSGGIYKTDRWTGDTTFIRGGTAIRADQQRFDPSTARPEQSGLKPYDGPVVPLNR